MTSWKTCSSIRNVPSFATWSQLGRGAAVKIMDSSVICHPAVVEKLEEIAGAEEIPVQRDILRAGGTDAGSIHITRSGVRTGGISVPCRYIHSPNSLCSIKDVEAAYSLVWHFLKDAMWKEVIPHAGN